MVQAFDAEKLKGLELDLWECFSTGLSPQRLSRHPVFWSLDRMKCFVLDLADSRQELRTKAGYPKLSENWLRFVKESPLDGFLAKQGRFYKAPGKTQFNGYGIVDLTVFMSNVVSWFCPYC